MTPRHPRASNGQGADGACQKLPDPGNCRKDTAAILGLVQAALNRPQARRTLEQALAAPGTTERPLLGDVEMTLARPLARDNQPAAALRHAEQARAYYQAFPSLAPKLREVDAWLAQQRRPVTGRSPSGR